MSKGGKAQKRTTSRGRKVRRLRQRFQWPLFTEESAAALVISRASDPETGSAASGEGDDPGTEAVALSSAADDPLRSASSRVARTGDRQ